MTSDVNANPEPRGLLAVFAHPDDETFGAGGILALAAQEGHPAWLICATNGDEGGLADDQGDHAMDPEIRRNELRCACDALGIAEPIFLGYRDSGMENWTPKPGAFVLADRDEIVGRIAAEIRRLRPAVVVTFDPGGGYGHPDHRLVSDVTTEAFDRVRGEPGAPTALYHQAIPRSDAEKMVAEWSRNDDKPDGKAPTEDDLLQRRRFLELSRPDNEISTRINVRPVLERKLKAFACHASQIRAEDWNTQEAEWEAALATELFVRVQPPPAEGETETNLLGL
jgi:LmbE family N-acetylglucosaminyl deacetylase